MNTFKALLATAALTAFATSASAQASVVGASQCTALGGVVDLVAGTCALTNSQIASSGLTAGAAPAAAGGGTAAGLGAGLAGGAGIAAAGAALVVVAVASDDDDDDSSTTTTTGS